MGRLRTPPRAAEGQDRIAGSLQGSLPAARTGLGRREAVELLRERLVFQGGRGTGHERCQVPAPQVSGCSSFAWKPDHEGWQELPSAQSPDDSAPCGHRTLS